MNVAVILSAGSGKRFKNETPKQLLPFNGSTVLSESINKFGNSKHIDGLVVVSHPDHIDRINELARSCKKILAVVAGGVRRQDSVFNALKWIKEHSSCNKVWVHDSARPLFSERLIERLYVSSLKEDAVIPIIPSSDTLKRIENGFVAATLDRSNIYRVQTPQVFSFEKLYNAYIKFSDTIDATDDAFLMEHFGVKIFTVEGEANNIKLTFPVDIKIAELLIGASNKL